MSDTVTSTESASQRQLIPPDSSLIQVWLTIARHPTREVFTDVARIATRTWIITSLAATAVLSLTINGLNMLKESLMPVKAPSPSYSIFGVPLAILPPTVATIVALVIEFTSALATAYAVALIMPTAQGALRARFYHVLGALAPAQTVVSAAGLLGAILLTSLALAVRSPEDALTCINGLIYVGLLAYGVTLDVNALSASSGRGRWAVFGVTILTTVVVEIILWYVPLGIIQALSTHR